MNDANKLTDTAARDAAIASIRATAEPGPRRVFVGKNADKAALLSLADAQGKPRLTLTVDANGNLQAVPATVDYGLITEPFVFVVGGDGIVKAKWLGRSNAISVPVNSLTFLPCCSRCTKRWPTGCAGSRGSR